MSDRSGVTQLGAGAPDGEEARERHVLLRTLKRLRALIVLVPLVVGLLVAASIGASKLWADLPERTPPVTEVECWNGDTLPADECPQPRGVPGLRWVFPGFDPRSDDCRRVVRGGPAPRPLEFACETAYDQRPVTIVYSVRTSLEAGLAYFERTYGDPPREDAGSGRLVFTSTRPIGGMFRTTVAYADHPFAVTVRAPAADVRDGALAELVDLRPHDQVLVQPAS